MSRTIHICQSVEGALKHWKSAEWRSLAKHNKCTVEEVKEYFWQCMREGKRVIPLGEPCEGFDYQKGCPGHENRIQVLQASEQATTGSSSENIERIPSDKENVG